MVRVLSAVARQIQKCELNEIEKVNSHSCVAKACNVCHTKLAIECLNSRRKLDAEVHKEEKVRSQVIGGLAETEMDLSTT